jgi:hypothetical protein
MPTKSKKSVARRPRASVKKDPGGHSPAQAYKAFLSAALAIPSEAVMSCRLDLPLALHNVQLGVENVLPQEARLRKELPKLNIDDLRSLPDVAAGLIYAADRQSGPPGKAEVAEKLLRLRQVREPMLLIAEGLAMLGLVPAERVTAIREGNGPIDSARDGIALEALYRENATALRNKHPFSPADLKEAADLGNYLVRAITPNGGRQRLLVQSDETQLRDRFYTLLSQRHAELRKAGFVLFGEALNAHVPALATRVVHSKKSAPPAPAPSPVPAAA